MKIQCYLPAGEGKKREFGVLQNTRIINLGLSDEEETSVDILINFLQDNPSHLGWRGKNKPDPASVNGRVLIAERFIEGRREVISPNSPTTVPDTMVSKIMELHFGYNSCQAERIKIEHQHSMSAENIVGGLLEKYIDSEASQSGWVHCVKELVRKVDFIKGKTGAWRLLQVKNRDNSENSSSSAIRDGTTIEKWFRTYSRTGKTNWEQFPDIDLKGCLSEKGFEIFVENYFSKLGV